MIAILLATGQNAAFYGLDEYLPVPLLPLADRPFLQHVIEYLVHKGVRHFEFVLSHLPEKIEARFGDGSRWGCSFRYHLTPSAGQAFRIAAGIASGSGDETILASGTRLPAFEVPSVTPDTLLVRNGVWTGWARFAKGARMFLSSASAMAAGNIEGLPVHSVSACLSIDSGDGFLEAQREALNGDFPGLMIGGLQTDTHVCICRNVALHPSVAIHPPVYVGENCQIGKGSQIGPSAVIGANCIVEAHSTVVNSMVSPGTYVGEALELDTVIVDRNRLVNFRVGASFIVSETFMLGSLTEHSRGRTLSRIRDRFIALSLLLLLWPVLLALFLYLKISGRGRTSYREMVELPAHHNPASWRNVRIIAFETSSNGRGGQTLHTFLPGLLSVLRGRIFLVGVQPRTRTEIESLSSDWRALYLKSKAGLITEADVMFGPNATEDDVYTAEAFYSATESSLHDLKLAGLWLRGLFLHPGRPVVGLSENLENS